jgi:hypothetical protein
MGPVRWLNVHAGNRKRGEKGDSVAGKEKELPLGPCRLHLRPDVPCGRHRRMPPRASICPRAIEVTATRSAIACEATYRICKADDCETTTERMRWAGGVDEVGGLAASTGD